MDRSAALFYVLRFNRRQGVELSLEICSESCPTNLLLDAAIVASGLCRLPQQHLFDHLQY